MNSNIFNTILRGDSDSELRGNTLRNLISEMYLKYISILCYLPETEDHAAKRILLSVRIPKRWRAPVNTWDVKNILVDPRRPVTILLWYTIIRRRPERSADFHGPSASLRDDQFNNNLHFIFAVWRLLHKSCEVRINRWAFFLFIFSDLIVSR